MTLAVSGHEPEEMEGRRACVAGSAVSITKCNQEAPESVGPSENYRYRLELLT